MRQSSRKVTVEFTANQLHQVIESIRETINELDAFDEPDDGLVELTEYLTKVEQTEVVSH